MAEIKKRKVHSAEFKGKVGLEAVRGVKTVNEIAQQHSVHPVMVAQWVFLNSATSCRTV
jgi:transposase